MQLAKPDPIAFVRCMIACGILLNLGCASERIQAESSSNQVSSSTRRAETSWKAAAMVKRPATPQDLLENIKWGIENNVFLSENFYSDESIKRMFGADSIRWIDDITGSKKLAAIKPSAQPLSLPNPSNNCLEGAVMSWLIKAGGGPTPQAKLQISVELKYSDPYCAALSADLVQNLFGNPTKIESFFRRQKPPSPHRDIVPQRTTHPWGNSDVEYVLSSAPVSKRLKLEVLGSGTIRRFFVFMEEM